MNYQNPLPIQVLRRQTYVSTEARQSDATRAWNLSVSLYYKSGHIPWRPHGLIPGTCFVGISFHHLKRRSGDLIYASLAQAFSNEVEPFALQGGAIPQNQTRNRQPYLTEQQAAELTHRIIVAYEDRAGSRPSRVIVIRRPVTNRKKRKDFVSHYWPMAACELVWFTNRIPVIAPRHEPWRGALHCRRQPALSLHHRFCPCLGRISGTSHTRPSPDRSSR